jgi:hypothetical protein
MNSLVEEIFMRNEKREDTRESKSKNSLNPKS